MAPLQRNSSSKSKKSSTINHPTHPKHPLEELNNDSEYSCDGCNTSGVGTRYHCSICSFDLHEHCAKCPVKLSSYVHPRHALVLENKASIDRFCDVCGDLVNGLFYSCEECLIDIHPICTLFPLNAKHDPHPQHVLRLQPGKPGWCVECREICNFWRYRCNTCCIDVHPNCVSTGSSDRGGGGDGSATRGLQPPQTTGIANPTTIYVDNEAPTNGDGATREVVAQQVSQAYPPVGYPGEVPTGGVAIHTQQPTTSYLGAGHDVGMLNSGGSGGLASQGVPHQAPQAYPMAGYGVDVLTAGGSPGSPIKGIPNQAPQMYPPSGYPGEVLAGGGRTQSHIGNLASQGVQYQAQQSHPMAGYDVDGLNASGHTSSPGKGIPNPTPQTYPPTGYSGEVLAGAAGRTQSHICGLPSQGVPYQAQQPHPMAGYGVDVLTPGGHTGSPRKGIPHQTPQSYPVSRNATEVPTTGTGGGGSGSWGIPPVSYPQIGYGVGLPPGGYQMPLMMNPGFPMGMNMMMAQPPTMVIVHQNYPGQGNNFGMNQQHGMKQGNKKNNEEFDELAQMGKDVKKKMQFAAKYAMGLASAASTSLAGAPVNVANLMKKS
ncbi:hypothetical protein Leryth_008616 [Lithospermum erythrorhizon]|nr:hypothetical protein Leryth_008616 [Lithospermum erythrorhizon]